MRESGDRGDQTLQEDLAFPSGKIHRSIYATPTSSVIHLDPDLRVDIEALFLKRSNMDQALQIPVILARIVTFIHNDGEKSIQTLLVSLAQVSPA